MGWLLLLNAVKIAYWMLGFAGWYDTHNAYTSFMFYFPFNNIFWMGPLLYFYFLSLTNTNFSFQKKHLKHFILPLLFFVLILVKFVIDFVVYYPFIVVTDMQYGTKGPFADLDKNDWLMWIAYLSFFYYLIITIKAYRNYQLYALQNFSGTEEIRFNWLRNILYAIAAAVIIFFIFSLIGICTPIRRTYIFDWYSYLALGVIVYYLSIAAYFTGPGIKQQLHFEPGPKQPERVETKIVVNTEIETWKNKLRVLIENDQPYLDPELSLAELARKMNTNPSLLSKIINEGFHLNFNDFINESRVKVVIEKLKAGEQKTQTLLGIAYDCGFNSKATFNRAFKKVTGVSPKEWLDKRG